VKAISKFSIEWNGSTYTVEGDKMIILRNGEWQTQLDLAPVVEGRKNSIMQWQEGNSGIFKGRLSEGGAVFLQIREGHVAYWMKTQIPQIESLVYFPETSFCGDYWHGYCSDAYDRPMEKVVDVEIPLSSSYDDLLHPDIADGNGLTDPGDKPPLFVWNMPIKAFSFKSSSGWLGFTIPGPWPVGITRLKIESKKFSLGFEVIRPACCEGKLPVVYFVSTITDPYDLLNEERAISDRLGLTVKKSPEHPSFWSAPSFKAYLEQERLHREKIDAGKIDANRLEDISLEKFVNWVHTVKKDQQLNEMCAVLEQGAYNCYGDYRPTEQLGGIEGFRRMVDQLHEENVHMCFYIHPYMFNTKITFYKEHPEAFCKPKDKDHKTEYALAFGEEKPEYALIDWTHPLGREYMLDQIEILLSDKPGCLDCDWLRSNHWRSPDPRVYQFYDPNWGIGEVMSMKVQKLMYEKAKQVKPHACVSKVAFAAPWMQPYADVNLLCEEWNGWTDTWYTRGRIATRLNRDVIFLTDPFFVTITKSYEYFMGMATWNILEDPIVKHAIHPYGYFRELADKDFKRRKSGVKVQANSPINITDEIRVEPVENSVIMWRKRTQGPLAGWYASLAFGKKCFATYSETEVRIAASETRIIDLPLPPGTVVSAVEMVSHDNKVSKWQAGSIKMARDDGLRLQITDCGFEAMYFRVRYSLQRQQND
jgi:hypothetical protein